MDTYGRVGNPEMALKTREAQVRNMALGTDSTPDTPVTSIIASIERRLVMLGQMTGGLEAQLSTVLASSGPGTPRAENSDPPAPTRLLSMLIALDRSLADRCDAIEDISNRIVL